MTNFDSQKVNTGQILMQTLNLENINLSSKNPETTKKNDNDDAKEPEMIHSKPIQKKEAADDF